MVTGWAAVANRTVGCFVKGETRNRSVRKLRRNVDWKLARVAQSIARSGTSWWRLASILAHDLSGGRAVSQK
jgi:hypothetical protein